MQRIKISSTEFKISRPGYDVNTAAADQLAFDGFAGKYNGLYMSGVVAYDETWTWTDIGNPFLGNYVVKIGTKEILFGKTFAQPPEVIVSIRPTGNATVGGKPGYSAQHHTPAGSNIDHMVNVGAATKNDRLIIYQNRSLDNLGDFYSRDWEIAYLVFQT
jgi:hypothetical protein